MHGEKERYIIMKTCDYFSQTFGLKTGKYLVRMHNLAILALIFNMQISQICILSQKPKAEMHMKKGDHCS